MDTSTVPPLHHEGRERQSYSPKFLGKSVSESLDLYDSSSTLSCNSRTSNYVMEEDKNNDITEYYDIDIGNLKDSFEKAFLEQNVSDNTNNLDDVPNVGYCLSRFFMSIRQGRQQDESIHSCNDLGGNLLKCLAKKVKSNNRKDSIRTLSTQASSARSIPKQSISKHDYGPVWFTEEDIQRITKESLSFHDQSIHIYDNDLGENLFNCSAKKVKPDNRRDSICTLSTQASSVRSIPKRSISKHDYGPVWITEEDIQRITKEYLTTDDF